MKKEFFERDLNRLIDEKIADELIRVIAKRISKELSEIVYADKIFNFTRTSEKTIAASIEYLASIKANSPITLNELTEKYFSEPLDYETYEDNRKEKTKIGRQIKQIKRLLGMKYCEKPTIMGTSCIKLKTSKDYILDICDALKYNDQLKKKALKMARYIDKLVEFTGKNPRALAGAIVYYTGLKFKKGFCVTQEEVSRLSGVVNITLRLDYNLIRGIFDSNKEKRKRLINQRMVAEKIYDRMINEGSPQDIKNAKDKLNKIVLEIKQIEKNSPKKS
jgi:transcription initiation factor TFIIIB Brf1 subunit/transcription initiation factor TFIIB